MSTSTSADASKGIHLGKCRMRIEDGGELDGGSLMPITFDRANKDTAEILALRGGVIRAAGFLGAREVNPGHDTSKTLVDAIPGAVFTPTFDDAEAWIRANAREGDLIVTTGCGNLNLLCDRLVGKRTY